MSQSDAATRTGSAAQSDRAAYVLGVHTLFKFRAFRTHEQKARVRDILLNHRVYFAKPSSFEDPHDLKPLLEIRNYGSDAETRRAMLAAGERTWDRNGVATDERERARTWLMTAPLHLIEAHGIEKAHTRLDTYWVLSFAATRNRLVMWNLYADAGRGLCVHFRSDRTSPFGLAQRVDYMRTRPVLPVPFDDLPEHDVAAIATLQKTRRWEHEDEFRLVRYPDVPYEHVGLYFDDQYAKFPPAAITGITVGPQMPDSDIEEVLSLASAHHPPLPVCRPNGIVHEESQAISADAPNPRT